MRTRIPKSGIRPAWPFSINRADRFADRLAMWVPNSVGANAGNNRGGRLIDMVSGKLGDRYYHAGYNDVGRWVQHPVLGTAYRMMSDYGRLATFTGIASDFFANGGMVSFWVDYYKQPYTFDIFFRAGGSPTGASAIRFNCFSAFSPRFNRAFTTSGQLYAYHNTGNTFGIPGPRPVHIAYYWSDNVATAGELANILRMYVNGQPVTSVYSEGTGVGGPLAYDTLVLIDQFTTFSFGDTILADFRVYKNIAESEHPVLVRHLYNQQTRWGLYRTPSNVVTYSVPSGIVFIPSIHRNANQFLGVA